MNPLIQLKKQLLQFSSQLACFGLSPMAQALLPPPPPDGGYPNHNTAEGDDALFSTSQPAASTRPSVFKRFITTRPASFNTASGRGALS